MADLDDLLRRAAPRLARGDEAAAKLRAKLASLARAAWGRGPEALARLGVDLPEGAWRALPPGAADDAALRAIARALGGRGFVRFIEALEARRRAAAKERRASGARPAASGDGPATSGRRAEAAAGDRQAAAAELTISSTSSGSDDADAPALAVPDEDAPLRLRFEEEEEAPLRLRFEEAPAAAPAAAKPAEVDEDADPGRAAERALGRYRSAGDPDELEAARRLFLEAARAAEGGPAKAAARGGLALTLLLQGDLERCREQATKALAAFPGEPRALEALLRAGREDEAARAQVEAALARARAAVARGDEQAARAGAAELDRLAPEAPFAPLVELALHQLHGARDEDPEPFLAAAWERYPGPPLTADLALGAALERPVIQASLGWLRGEIESAQGQVLVRTVNDIESKQNVHAGAGQLALGVARAALAQRERLAKGEEQELRKWVGQALLCMQHYDQAVEALQKARALDRNGDHVLEINADETRCGVMRRAFDKPGVKARLGSLDGAGIVGLRRALAARLTLVLAQRDAAQVELEADEAEVVGRLVADPARRTKVAARAALAGKAAAPDAAEGRDEAAPDDDGDVRGAAAKAAKAARAAADTLAALGGPAKDPFARLAAAEAELARLDAEADAGPAAAEPPPAPEGGRLLGRMKAGLTRAFDKAKTAARGAERSLRRGVAEGQKKEAERALAVLLRAPPDGGWQDPELDALLARGEAIRARLDHLEAEAEALRRLAGRAGAV